MGETATILIPQKTLQTPEDLADKLQKETEDIITEAIQIGIHELKLRHALELYRKGKISFGRTSELTGLGYRELHLELKRNIPYRYAEPVKT